MELQVVAVYGEVDWDQLKYDIATDVKLLALIALLQRDPGAKKGWSYVGEMLYYKGKMVLPKSSSMVEKLLQEFHNSPAAGHRGYLRTFKRISIEFFWEGMRNDIKKFVVECPICQQNKYDTLSPAGLL